MYCASVLHMLHVFHLLHVFFCVSGVFWWQCYSANTGLAVFSGFVCMCMFFYISRNDAVFMENILRTKKQKIV